MSEDLSAPAALICERMGLHYTQDRWPDLARGLEKAAAALGFTNGYSFITHLLADQFGQREVQALASFLTIGETHFFRTPELFTMLESWLLPELIAGKQATRSLRIWSAACATGQEPYSLGILLSRLIPKPEQWDVTILATDINPDAFAAARVAEYTQWSFRGTPAWVINNYFTKISDGRYRLDPAIRDVVTFRYLNLADDIYPSAATGISDFDLILCRNVLMYFSPAMVKQVGERLHRSLRESGYLVVTPREASRDVQCGMTSMLRGGEILYKKTLPQAMPAAETTASEAFLLKPGHGREQAAGERGGRSIQKSRQQAAAAAPAPSPQNRADAPGGAWPAVDRRHEGRPFAAFAKHRAEAEAVATRSQPKQTVRAERPASRAEAQEAAREARALADKGDRKRALARLQAALEADKLNPSLYYLKASILQELGRHDEAEQALQSSLFLDGNFALARVMLGAIARGQSRTGDATKHFYAALLQLEQMPPDYVLPETDGLTAGEMAETVASLMGSECAL